MTKFSQFAVVVISIMFASNLVAQPKIEAVGGTSIELGDHYQGQKVERVVHIKNVGNDTLRIKEVKAQCGCTATLLSTKTLGPNAEGELSITFDTHNSSGRVTKQVYVSSNDTTNPKLTISFSANVLQVLTMAPPSFAFNDAKLDSTYTRTITITNPSKTDKVKILSMKSPTEAIKLSLMENVLMPGSQTQLQATFHATKSGTDRGAIELLTDHPAKPKFDITYFVWVNRK